MHALILRPTPLHACIIDHQNLLDLDANPPEQNPNLGHEIGELYRARPTKTWPRRERTGGAPPTVQIKAQTMGSGAV